MWQFRGNDVPFCDFSLTNPFGLGHVGYTQPVWGTPINPINPVNPIGFLPYGTPPVGFTPFVRPVNFFKTDVTPFFGLKDFFTPMTWGTPFGVEKFGTMRLDNFGFNPWFVNGPIGFNPTEELWRRTLPFTTPIYTHTLPFTNTVGLFGTPYGFTGWTPFGFNTIDEKLKFNTPFTTGMFGFNTPTVDWSWKLKSFGTPETWNTTVRTSIPWTGRVPGPVAVL